MKYAKIKQGTEAWDLMHKIFNFKKEWGKLAEPLESFLGFPIDGNIAFEVTNLWVDPKALRKHRPDWEKEFKKSDGEITSAKANSKVKKEWIDLCKRLGLETYNIRDFSLKYDLIFCGNRTFHRYDDSYFMTLDNDKYDFDQHEWAEEIDEPQYLRIRADYLEKESKESLKA